ncbi:c755278f-fe23-4f90-ac09-1ea68d87ee8b [Thermothielavioides terrestris]|uniref:Nitrate/nitrite transporter n=1 Tax=Thermothielavioides terrestris TaxID=2587410 RepID=A0A446B8A3_9PEZI|nr:c755278f-fe23-4f90-ac09-1ea68d87ee8b [Thermothielavioides terrestris]
MGFRFSHLYARPDVNPVTLKARSVPVLNPIDVYGRVFFFSWFGFMIAFWAWYTFPPLLTHTIKNDLQLSPAEVANSNIVSLCATLLVRVVAGPLCDQFGPRKVFGGLLLAGAIPLGLAPLVQNASGLYASRFFIGILGGCFVPCQVWSTGFFDKNVVGTANALTGGFGNAGGGITYFIMPAVYDALVGDGHTPREAWRLTFLVPLAMVIATAIALILLCPDTPTGKWRDRHLQSPGHPAHDSNTDADTVIVDVPGRINDPQTTGTTPTLSPIPSKEKIPAVRVNLDLEAAKPTAAATTTAATTKTATSTPLSATALQQELIRRPTVRETLRVAVSQQTIFHTLTYMCSFGTELAINAVLASYYAKNFPQLGQTAAANWAAMFGFLNFVTRPLGGIVSDLLYNLCGGGSNSSGGSSSGGSSGALWLKKGWVVACGLLTGAVLVAIGARDPHDRATMFGLVALLAVFVEAGNGANFSLVPHVHPFANGVVSGLTGAGGNLGGVLFAVVFRFMDDGTDYAKAFWVIGVVNLAVNAAVAWIPPLPKGQVGGR